MTDSISLYASNLNSWLIGALAVGILFQTNSPRLYAAFLFSAVLYAHELIMYDADGILYYGSAASLDLLAVILMGMVSPLPRMVLRLQMISFLFIIVNFIGWIMWYLYQPPLVYNILCAILFSLAFITLLLRDKKDVGGFTMAGWRSCICLNGASLLFYTVKYEKKL
tara:strand:- start:165 stop:665 length:501 start_codon:yes stop_codon:yes gene_type:complete